MRHLLIFLGGCAVFVIWAVSAYSNYLYGVTLGVTEHTGQVFGAASISSDVLKSSLPFAIAIAYAARRYIASFVALGLLVLCGGYSLISAYGFASTNIFKSIQPNLVQEKISKARFDQIDLEKNSISWLQSQTVSKSRRERRRMTGEVNAARKSLDSKIKALEETKNELVLDATPHATPIAKFFKVERKDVLTFFAVAFVLLIESISFLGWFVLFKTHKPLPKDEPLEPDKCRLDEPDEGGGEGGVGVDVAIKEAVSSNIVPLKPKNEVVALDERLDHWLHHKVELVIEPAIKASFAFKCAVPAIGPDLTEDIFYKFMRKNLPEDKVKRFRDGVHYFIAIQEQGASDTALAA